MSIPTTIKRYLDKTGSYYEQVDLPAFKSIGQAAKSARIPLTSMVQAVPMVDRFGLIMAIIPAHRKVDYVKLTQTLGRALEPASTAQVLAVFRDCDSTFLPPLGEAYGVRTILDDSLMNVETVYFMAGDSNSLIKLERQYFFQMQSNAWIGSDFTRAANETAVGGAATEAASGMRAMDIARQLHAIKDLPPMPKMAQEIFRLSSNPYAGARELAAIVQLDPSLAAQVMRYAASPFFSYQGKVDSIQTAISRVLGYDMVMNLALGLATAKPFRVQRTGPLGLDNFWRHATYTAAIAQALCNEVPAGQRPKPGLCYLAGLLHNFGHLLLGHLFKQEFLMLNEEVKKHPEKAVVDIEQKLLGIDHTEIGVWLMQAWGLPEEVIVATQEHHNPAYTGPFSQYSEIVMVADHMLRSHGMGDAPTDELPHTVLESLGLTEVQTLQVMNRVLEGCEGLNAMAQQLAA